MKAVKAVAKAEVVSAMLNEIRNSHIDIMPLIIEIIEEIIEILPQLIESVVKNVYVMVEEVG